MTSNYINWNVDPEIINVFGVSVICYGLLFVSGLILCIYILGWIYKRENIPSEHLEKLSIYGMIGILAGARLGHCLFYEPSYYLSHPLEMILPITFPPEGGIKFIGILTTKPWGVIFERVDNVPRHPAQLYEAISYFIIFTIMMILYKKMRDRLKNGFFFGLVLVLCFTARFIIEFVKENQVGFENGMTFNMGQLLSLPYIVVGIGFIIYGLWKTKRLSAQSSRRPVSGEAHRCTSHTT